MPSGIKVVGLKELDRSFRAMRTEIRKQLKPQLKEAGELVRAEGQSLFNRIDARSAAGYKVRVRARGVVVEQSLPRVTGLRGDYGALQMRVALDPALQAKSADVEKLLDDMVTQAIQANGF